MAQRPLSRRFADAGGLSRNPMKLLRPCELLGVKKLRGNYSINPERPLRVVLSHSPTTEFGQ